MKTLEHGIILHRIPYSETSWVVKCFTRDHGLRSLLVQGGRKKYAALIQAMSPIEFNRVQRHEEQMGKMYDPRLLENLDQLRFDPVKAGIVFFEAEMLLNCLAEGQSDKLLFDFVYQELILLDAENVSPLYPLYWSLQLSNILGFYPHAPAEVAVSFDLENGEFYADNHVGKHIVSGELVPVLQQLLLHEREAFLSLTIPKRQRAELLQLLQDYFKLHIPHFKPVSAIEMYQTIWNA